MENEIEKTESNNLSENTEQKTTVETEKTTPSIQAKPNEEKPSVNTVGSGSSLTQKPASKPSATKFNPTAFKNNLASATLTPSTPQTEKKTIVAVGEEEKRPPVKQMPKWLKIIIFSVLTIIFVFACVFIGYFVYSLVRTKGSEKTNINISLLTTQGVTYTIRERVVTNANSDNESVSIKNISENDLSFTWENGSEVTYEITVEFNPTHYFRFRQYEMYFDDIYIPETERMLDVDFVSLTSNFDSKFTLKNGYYYFNKSSQPTTKITFICKIKFDIDDYRDQFDGAKITEVFDFQSTLNPDEDWGYYSYMFE